jgi:hypothetical protein
MDPEPKVTSVRTLSPSRLPADHRHASMLRLPQHAPSLATSSAHRPDGGGVKLLRIDRGRVVVHPNGTLTQEGPTARDVMGQVNTAGSPHRAGGRGEGEACTHVAALCRALSVTHKDSTAMNGDLGVRRLAQDFLGNCTLTHRCAFLAPCAHHTQSFASDTFQLVGIPSGNPAHAALAGPQRRLTQRDAPLNIWSMCPARRHWYMHTCLIANCMSG